MTDRDWDELCLADRGHDAISHSCDVVTFVRAGPRAPQVPGFFAGTELAR